MSDPLNGVSARTRLLLFLYSNKNRAGSLLALVGLGGHFVGLVGAYWLPIVAGLYGIGYLAVPNKRDYDLTLGGELKAQEIGSKLSEFVERISNQVEPDVVERVKHIRDSIDSLLPRLLQQESVGDRRLFTVRQTAVEYLPATLQSYVRLPTAFRRLHTVRGGKTPKELLLEQLDLLDKKMKEIVASVAENDTQALLVNGRFLEEKFGKGGFLLGEEAR